MTSLRLTDLADGRKAVIIRTSDRIAFKQCRRKWGFSSHLKKNLAPNNLAAPLWFGSAIHYALEDYHGWNRFGHPREAFKAYCLATAQNYKRELPPDAQEHYELGKAMMDYYIHYWLGAYPRKPDATYWEENAQTGLMEPQVEVNFEIPIPIDPERTPLLAQYVAALGADCVLYRGTIDRVAIDDFGHLWIVEYKTAKMAQNTHFATDPQVTTYVWAASLIYDRPVAGVIYQQFVKKMPNPPRLLNNGQISTAANMITSYPLYKEALEAMYGELKKSPAKNVEYMNRLMSSENDQRDRYIIRENIVRNTQQGHSEAWKIMMELEDMLNPDLPLYPNPTRDCTRMCSFLTTCVNMDDGSDWEQLLEEQYSERDQDVDRMWRRRMPSPEQLLTITNRQEEPDLLGIQLQSMDQYKMAQIAAGDYPLAEWESEPNPFGGMNEKGSFNMAEVDV